MWFKKHRLIFFFGLEYSNRFLHEGELCRDDVGSGHVTMFEDPTSLRYFASVESQRQRGFRISHCGMNHSP